MKIVITLSNKNARIWKYFLGLKYGTRKGLKRLIMCAAYEIIAEMSRKVLEEMNEMEK